MYNLLTVAVGFDRLNTNVCRRSTAFPPRSFRCQIHMSRRDIVDNSRPALKVMGSRTSMEGIPSSSSRIHHTVNDTR